MLACHMLLGRPCQFDRDILHHGRSNKYSFVVEGRKHILTPLTPYQVKEDYKIIKELREEFKRKEVEEFESSPREQVSSRAIDQGEGTSSYTPQGNKVTNQTHALSLT